MGLLEEYQEALYQNDIDEMLDIERMFHLDGYPPGVVIHALTAEAEGEDMYKAIDDMMGA